MNELVLDRMLCLPAPDLTSLLIGQTIIALPKVFLQRGWSFLLYPCPVSLELPVERQYRPYAMRLAQANLVEQPTGINSIISWAICDSCTLIFEREKLGNFVDSTPWTITALQKMLEQREHLFFSCLRVYQLPHPISIFEDSIPPDKFGKFVSLPTVKTIEKLALPLKVAQFLPILSEANFNQKRQQIEEGKPPLHSELEELLDDIALSVRNDHAFQELSREIQTFLGWQSDSSTGRQRPGFSWIRTITDTGNSSNGNDFEKLVRKSLLFLGFTNTLNNPKASLDPGSTGGAGGLDVFCKYPYPVVGECKASQHDTVSNSVSAQLIHLGNTHLGKSLFNESIKIIFAAGILTQAAEMAAIQNQINVMRPETLERLAELNAKHPGAIDLCKLKPCLEASPFGTEADDKINNFINDLLKKLKVRSHIVQTIKQLAEIDFPRTQFEVTEIRVQYNAIYSPQDGQSLGNQVIHELLIELSSPLVGYVGRLQAIGSNSDRFYFLRDLQVD
jgi:hypothetical protein